MLCPTCGEVDFIDDEYIPSYNPLTLLTALSFRGCANSSFSKNHAFIIVQGKISPGSNYLHNNSTNLRKISTVTRKEILADLREDLRKE